MNKKKPIGYSKKDTSEMKALIERTAPKSGDYVGSGTVTTVPKKKKKMKRMMDGGMANAMSGRMMNPALAASMQPTSPRGTGTNDGGPAPSSMGGLGTVKTPVRGTGTNDGGPAPSSTGSLGAVKTPVRGPAQSLPPGAVRGPDGGIRLEGKPGPVRGPAQSLPPGAVRGPDGGIRLEGKPGPVRGPGMGGGMGAPDYTTMPIRGGGGVPVQGPGGVVIPPSRPKGPKRPGFGKIFPKMRQRLEERMGRSGKGAEYPGMPKKRGMKGGGLARKGVGMALAKGGLVKANGCAQRGKTKGRMV